MGSTPSKSENEKEVFRNQIPVEISQDVVNYIADKELSSEVSPQRQSILDAHIRERVQSEVDSLRAQEDVVRQEIERALEKENLDRERGEDDGSTLGDVKASAALLGDIDEIRMKMGKFQSRQTLAGSVAASESGEALTACYKTNASTPLNCWREMSEFKSSVAQMEQEYMNSLR